MFDQTCGAGGSASNAYRRRAPSALSVEWPTAFVSDRDTNYYSVPLCPTPQLFSLGSNSECRALFRFIPPRLYVARVLVASLNQVRLL